MNFSLFSFNIFFFVVSRDSGAHSGGKLCITLVTILNHNLDFVSKRIDKRVQYIIRKWMENRKFIYNMEEKVAFPLNLNFDSITRYTFSHQFEIQMQCTFHLFHFLCVCVVAVLVWFLFWWEWKRESELNVTHS